MKTKLHARSLFLSDIHLGFRDCKANYLLELLDNIDVKRIYLIGDIIDFYSLKKQIHWPGTHYEIILKLIELQKRGSEIIYIPGNHDQALRKHINELFADIKIVKEAIYTTLSGKKLLLCHGDEFDSQVCLGKWQARLGDHLYDLLLFINRANFKIRRFFNLPYFSLSSYIKATLPKANQIISRYREAVMRRALIEGYDGVVCGHIHMPEIVQFDGLVYINDGDWVEHCSAVIETHHGQIQLFSWTEDFSLLEVCNAFEVTDPVKKRLSKIA